MLRARALSSSCLARMMREHESTPPLSHSGCEARLLSATPTIRIALLHCYTLNVHVTRERATSSWPWHLALALELGNPRERNGKRPIIHDIKSDCGRGLRRRKGLFGVPLRRLCASFTVARLFAVARILSRSNSLPTCSTPPPDTRAPSFEVMWRHGNPPFSVPREARQTESGLLQPR